MSMFENALLLFTLGCVPIEPDNRSEQERIFAKCMYAIAPNYPDGPYVEACRKVANDFKQECKCEEVSEVP